MGGGVNKHCKLHAAPTKVHTTFSDDNTIPEEGLQTGGGVGFQRLFDIGVTYQ